MKRQYSYRGLKHAVAADWGLRSGAERGFTLVEMTVSIALMGILAVVMVKTMNEAMDIWAWAENSRRASLEMFHEMNQMARYIRQMEGPVDGFRRKFTSGDFTTAAIVHNLCSFTSTDLRFTMYSEDLTDTTNGCWNLSNTAPRFWQADTSNDSSFMGHPYYDRQTLQSTTLKALNGDGSTIASLPTTSTAQAMTSIYYTRKYELDPADGSSLYYGLEVMRRGYGSRIEYWSEMEDLFCNGSQQRGCSRDVGLMRKAAYLGTGTSEFTTWTSWEAAHNP